MNTRSFLQKLRFSSFFLLLSSDYSQQFGFFWYLINISQKTGTLGLIVIFYVMHIRGPSTRFFISISYFYIARSLSSLFKKCLVSFDIESVKKINLFLKKFDLFSQMKFLLLTIEKLVDHNLFVLVLY